MRLLIVDDDPKLRNYVCAGLEQSGIEGVPAPDGQSALAILEDDHRGFDLILLDVMMPEVTGWDLLADLRERGLGGVHDQSRGGSIGDELDPLRGSAVPRHVNTLNDGAEASEFLCVPEIENLRPSLRPVRAAQFLENAADVFDVSLRTDHDQAARRLVRNECGAGITDLKLGAIDLFDDGCELRQLDG